jgi:threonine aldolase
LKAIDLRSDTVTEPTLEMRRAMAEAEVGDDGYRDDPTVNRLEEAAAAVTGKEAALFVPSGTMGNLISVLTHCQRGEEIVLGDQAHIYYYEVGGASALGSLVMRQVPNDVDGTMDLDQLEQAIRPEALAVAPTRLVCLENTHNRCSGAVIPPSYVRNVFEIAQRHGVSFHLDGARVFNAATYLGLPVSDVVAPFDTVLFCLSKGLCCPVGSLLCGSLDFISRARRIRRMVGGGMRQAGILAAAGLVAFETTAHRLAEDHANAKLLADGLANIPGVTLDPTRIQTNIVIFELADGNVQGFLQALAKRGVKAGSPGGTKIRMVTHLGIGAEDIDTALGVTEGAVKMQTGAN